MMEINSCKLYINLGIGLAISATVAYIAFKAGSAYQSDEDEKEDFEWQSEQQKSH